MKVNGGTLLLKDLCLAMRSDPLGVIRGFREVLTCLYGPAATIALPDPLTAAFRHSFIHVSLISVLDRTTLSWNEQEYCRKHRENQAFDWTK